MPKINSSELILALAAAKDFDGLVSYVGSCTELSPADSKNAEAFVYCGLSANKTLIQCFLKHSFDINLPCKGRRIIHAAAHVPHPEFFSFLIGLGADVNSRDHQEKTPLMIISQQAQRFTTVRDKWLSMLEIACESRARVNDADIFRRTALDYSCRADWFDGAKLLIDHGANIHSCSDKGEYCFQTVTLDCINTSLMELLLSKGANPNMLFFDNIPLIQQAARMGKVKHVQVLLDAGVSDTFEDGSSAIGTANAIRDSLDAMLEQSGISKQLDC